MYQIRPYNTDRRIKNNFIVITQCINLIESDQMINPVVYKPSYKYTWGLWQDYFLKDLYKPALPIHYFEELLDQDYVINKGLPDQTRSYFLRDLANNGIIYPHFREAILIGVAENFTLEIPEQRMYDHLIQKVIMPLMYQYNISYNNVRILDDCLVNNWNILLDQSKLNYDIQLHKYFDPITLKLSLGRFDKKRL